MTTEASISPTADLHFHDDCTRAIQRLSEATRAVYATLSLDIGKPQEAARALAIDKNLAWKVSRMAMSTDPLSAATLVPGTEAIRILMQALLRADAPASAISALKEAADHFETMVDNHAGDRASLQILLDGRSENADLENSRKLAFRGLAGLWGIQARVRSMIACVRPNEGDSSKLDMAIVGGLHDIRRMRQLEGWPLFRFQTYKGETYEPVGAEGSEPIEPAVSGDDPLLIVRSFCDPKVLPVRSVRGATEIVHELTAGPIGRKGASTLVFGRLERATANRFANLTTQDEYGEFNALINVPCESLLFDVVVHRSMAEVENPEALVHGRPFGSMPLDAAAREQLRLPIRERIRPVVGGPSRWGSDLCPRHSELLHAVIARAGGPPTDYRVFRMEMDFPPMPSTVTFRYRLPTR